MSDLFTVWRNCSRDNLKNFANSWPSASNFKSFSRSLEQFFLTVGQNKFGNKIPRSCEKWFRNLGFSHMIWPLCSSGMSVILSAAAVGCLYIMAIWVVEFSNVGYKIMKNLPKNQHIQRKSLNFEFWINGKLSKSPKIWLLCKKSSQSFLQ